MKFIREILLQNWAIKLTAFFLAFFLWLSVRGDRNVERIITVPLELRVPRNMEVTNERPSFVEVTVRGSPSSQGFWPSGPVAYTIDLLSAGEGVHDVPLSPGNVRIPATSGLEVVRVSPARIRLVLEQTITSTVRVATPPVEGTPAQGIDVYSVSHWPTQVTITGPRSRVEEVAELKTTPVSVEGLSGPLRTFVYPIVDDHSLRIDPAGPVEVNIQLGAHREVRSIAGVPVTAPGEELRITPARITVQALVPISVKEKLGPEHFSATIPPGALDPSADEAKVKPEVQLVEPPDPAIVIDRIRPAEVTVRRIRKS